MTYELFPRAEPDRPLKRVPPGFAEEVMQRIEAYGRRRTRNRLAVILLTGLGLITAERATVNRYWNDDGGLDALRTAHAISPAITPANAVAAPQVATTQTKAAAAPAPVNVPPQTQAANHTLAKSGARNPVLDALQLQQMLDAANCAQVENAPADSPHSVTFPGSPPNAVMFARTHRSAAC